MRHENNAFGLTEPLGLEFWHKMRFNYSMKATFVFLPKIFMTAALGNMIGRWTPGALLYI